MSTTKVQVQCYWTDPATGESCDELVEVELEREPGEMYGSDADGNRGVWQEGGWQVLEVGVCKLGHQPSDDAPERAMEKADDEIVVAEPDDEEDWWDSMGGNDD